MRPVESINKKTCKKKKRRLNLIGKIQGGYNLMKKVKNNPK